MSNSDDFFDPSGPNRRESDSPAPQSSDGLFPGGPVEAVSPGTTDEASTFGEEADALHPAGPAETSWQTSAGSGAPVPPFVTESDSDELHVRGPHRPDSPPRAKPRRSPVKVLAIAAAGLLVLGGAGTGAYVYLFAPGPEPTIAGPITHGEAGPTPTPQPTPEPLLEPDRPTEDPVTSPAGPVEGESFDELLIDPTALADTLSPEQQQRLDELEQRIMTGRGMTRDGYKRAGKWADEASSQTDDPRVREVIRKVWILADDSLDDTPVQIPDDDEPSGLNSDFESDAGAPALGTQLLTIAHDILFLGSSRRSQWVAYSLLQNDARQQARLQPPRWMDPANAPRLGRTVERIAKDAEIWDEAARTYQDEMIEPLLRAAAAEKLARLCSTYGETSRAIQSNFCIRGLRIVEDALQQPGLTAEEERQLKDVEYRLRSQWDRLQVVLAEQLAAAAEKAEAARKNSQQAARDAQDSAAQASTAATQANDAERAALVASRTAAGTYLAQLQQRLETLQQSSDPALVSAAEKGSRQAEQIAQQIDQADDLATLDAPLRQLARGVLALEARRAPDQILPLVVTRQYAEEFLSRLSLPDEGELVGRDETPASFPESRFGRIYRRAVANEQSLREQISSLGPDEQFTPEQSQQVHALLGTLLQEALMLETRRQIAGIALEGGAAPPSLPQAERQLAADLSKLRRELTAIGTRLNEARAEQQRQTSSVTNLESRMRHADRQASQQREALRRELASQLESELAKPRPLPPGEAEQLAAGVTQSVLKILALYGYAPPQPSGVAGEDRVPPDHDAPHPLLAKDQYAFGVAAFNDGRLQDALTSFIAASRNDPTSPLYRYYLGLTLYRMGRVPEAVSQVQAGRRIELTGQQRNYKALEKVQGSLRMWLETVRAHG